jgi:hypothetical protein
MERNQLDACRDERGFIDISCLNECKKSLILSSNATYLYELNDCQVTEDDRGTTVNVYDDLRMKY